MMEDQIRAVIRSVPAMAEFQFHDFEYLYDPDEKILHVVFNRERDADDSFFAEDSGSADGNVLIHLAQGMIVGFSILDTELGKESS